ncbi:hypothetical protein [Mycobacterium sp. 141]|uniref:hypothetical protein n=1 Tax=Mycobacterium sp. 141 TaxID=1120797 RepID=UPI0003613782|nr:hypothetical protein [Mycobacterium sp. 141]
MSENSAASGGRLDLIARIVGLQLIRGNVHHLESLTKLSAFAATVPDAVTVDSGTFAEFVQRFEQDTGEAFADDGRFEYFVTAEVPFYSRSYLALQGYDPTSGIDVGHLLLAVFGAHDFDFPAEYQRNIRALTHVLLTPADYLARQFGYRRQQLAPPKTEEVTVPGDQHWVSLSDALQFNFTSAFAGMPTGAVAYVQRELFTPIDELHTMDPVVVPNLLLSKPFVFTPAGQVVIAAPRDLTTTLRHKIIAEASRHGCLDSLHAATREIATKLTRRLTLPLFDPPGATVDELDTHTVRLRGAIDSDKRLVVNIRVPPLETSNDDVFPGPVIGAFPLNTEDVAAGERTLTLDIVWPMGRDLILMSGDEERHLIGSFDEFELILFTPGTDQLTLWYFAEAWDRLGESTRLLHPGISAVYGLYNGRHDSFYIDDDSPPPHLLVVESDYSEELRRSFATRIGRAQVHIANRIYESHLKHGPATTVREVLAPPRHIFSAELDDVVIWAEIISDSEDDAYGLHSFPEAICYWAEVLNQYDPTVFEAYDRDIHVLIKYIGEADETDQPWIFEGDPVHNKNFVFQLRAPQRPPADAPPNHLDREVLAELARALLSDRLSGHGLTQETESIVEALAPPGERRMVHIVQSHVDLIAWPGKLPSARRVQPAVLARLLDELGCELREHRGRGVGEITEADRRAVLNKEVVPFFGGRLESRIKGFKGMDLLRSLILQNEALIHEEYTERTRYASRLACFGRGPDEAERLAKHLTATNTASVCSRFLIEYTAALHPQGADGMTDEAYDLILALASEVVNKGFISDALHAGISQAELSILPSGRLGISRDTDRYTQGLQGLMSATAQSTIDEAVAAATQREEGDASQKDAFAVAEQLATREFGFNFTELSLFTSELVNLSHEENQGDVGILSVPQIQERMVEKFNWEVDFINPMLSQLCLREVEEFWALGAEVLPWRFNRSRSYLRKPLICWNVRGTETVIFGHRNTIRTSFELHGQYLSGRLQARTKEMKEALSRAREEKGENFERRIESTLTGVCDPILRRVHKFGDLDLHDAQGVDLGDIDILAFDPSSQSLYVIEAKSLIVARTPRELQNEVSNIHEGEHSAVERLRGRYDWVLQNYQDVLKTLDLTAADVTVVPLIVIDADLVSARFESPFDIVTLDNLLTYMKGD